MATQNRILVVDDNPMNLAVLREALDGLYEIAIAEDGTTALSIAPSFLPDVVLLDVMMPGRDGYDVCRCFKRDHSLRQTRIVMVSARAELAARLQGYDAGADDYITKPFREEELLTKITFALRTKRLESLCGATGEILALVTELRDTDIDPRMPLVRGISQLLASELANDEYGAQLDTQFIDDLYQAAALRDVGMLSVPELLRDKSCPPNVDEIEQIKQHTLVGSRLLNRLATEHPHVSLFRMATEIARSHHERFDGTGYPDRSTGNEIPLSARIVHTAESVCEALEVAGLEAEGAIQLAVELTAKQSGSRLDPVTVAAVPKALEKLRNLEVNDIQYALVMN